MWADLQFGIELIDLSALRPVSPAYSGPFSALEPLGSSGDEEDIRLWIASGAQICFPYTGGSWRKEHLRGLRIHRAVRFSAKRSGTLHT